MQSLSGELRNRLAAAVKAARRTGEAGARSALGVLGVGDSRAHPSLSPDQQDLRRRLRAHGRQLGDRLDVETGVQQVERLVHEVAYEHWHRMLFARFLAENDLLIEPESGVAVSLIDCEELARERGQDCWTVAGRFAERMLPRIFRSDDPALAVPLAPETRQELERLLELLPPAVFLARDSLGWTYQFWQAERKEAVNRRGVKIGADELPAVTQLFTERYMVLFLLHNTVGAWRAGRVLAAQPELAAAAASEDELRRAMRLEAAGGYDFSYLRFVREPREDDEEGQPTGPWRPAAGIFTGWPRAAAELRVLDPCCGSGHFLVEGLDLLARLRMDEERLAPVAAVEAVLRDNLFGLEIDPRCTQIAAFNLALAAWTWPGAGAHRPLPALNLACSGLGPNATRDDWTAMAEAAADAGGLPAKRNLLGVDDSLLSAPLRNSLGALHDLFVQAPVLGSLIDPNAVQADLFQHDYESTSALLGALLQRDDTTDEQTERAVAARGMALAAELLAGRYHLVITNVPYLASGKQTEMLKRFAQNRYSAAKPDLATLFVSRNFGWLLEHGVQAVVTPQNWLYLPGFRKLREKLLIQRTWHLVAQLGPAAFETIGGHVVNVALGVLSPNRAAADWRMAGVDVTTAAGAAEKAILLRGPSVSSEPSGDAAVASERPGDAAAGRIAMVSQASMRAGLHVVRLVPSGFVDRLGDYARAWQGLVTGDDRRFLSRFWEHPRDTDTWIEILRPPQASAFFTGRDTHLKWERGVGDLHNASGAHNFPPQHLLGRRGIAIQRMNRLAVTLYSGEVFSDTVAPLIPASDRDLEALWEFAASVEFRPAVRLVNQKINLTPGSFSDVAFDFGRWRRTAAERLPYGLPKPYSDDPTQWVFHGHPCASVVWQSTTKRTAHGEMRTDATVLQVAVARLVGYRWPAETDAEISLAAAARALVDRCRDFDAFADVDGIVCLASVAGEPSAADRLRQLLSAAYDRNWSGATERQLVGGERATGRPVESIEAWLRDYFFEEHCRVFRQRPFIWHVWDGQRDGFHALLNYHRLAGPGGEGRRTLEGLTYRYVGEWIARQEADRVRGVEGAEGRVAAAQDLQNQLRRILAGEPPCGLFVRWKPLREQPLGWEPDINDGVRINIRPFMSVGLVRGGRAGAGILRIKPKID